MRDGDPYALDDHTYPLIRVIGKGGVLGGIGGGTVNGESAFTQVLGNHYRNDDVA